MKNTNVLASVFVAAAMPGLAGGAEVWQPPIGFGNAGATVPRHSAFRQGRRFHSGRKGGNPAGSKLAKKAARGTLTIIAIR